MVPLFLLERFGPKMGKAVFFGGLLLALLLVGLAVYAVGRGDGKSGQLTLELQRENKTQVQVGDANTNASDARVEDAVRSEQQEKELKDALEATEDLDRQRALRGCVIMRQQGRDTSRIPACS